MIQNQPTLEKRLVLKTWIVLLFIIIYKSWPFSLFAKTITKPECTTTVTY